MIRKSPSESTDFASILKSVSFTWNTSSKSGALHRSRSQDFKQAQRGCLSNVWLLRVGLIQTRKLSNLKWNFKMQSEAMGNVSCLTSARKEGCLCRPVGNFIADVPSVFILSQSSHIPIRSTNTKMTRGSRDFLRFSSFFSRADWKCGSMVSLNFSQIRLFA